MTTIFFKINNEIIKQQNFIICCIVCVYIIEIYTFNNFVKLVQVIWILQVSKMKCLIKNTDRKQNLGTQIPMYIGL